MRWSDLISSALLSLKQRPFRTALTVLGVMIGTMAVVVMVSLGVGMTESITGDMTDNPSLTQVVVNGSKVNENDPDYQQLNASGIRNLEKYSQAESVIPVYTTSADIRINGFTAYFELQGIRRSDFAKLNIKLEQGTMPSTGTKMQMVVKDGLQKRLYDGDKSMADAKPDESLLNKPAIVTFTQLGGGGGAAMPFPGMHPDLGGGPAGGSGEPPKRDVVPIVGIAKDDGDMFSSFSAGGYVDLDALLSKMRKFSGANPLPGQRTVQSGNNMNTFVFSQVIIKTASLDDAESLAKQLREDNWDCFANIEFIRQMQVIAAIIQAVFGGIGFISLLVAAIGIANTMMMSVYERTKQIGIMKVLGASLRDIRRSFLIESAAIGFIGGLLGLLISLLISFVMNALAAASVNGEDAVHISVIPAWLMLGGVGFSTLIGMLAGFIPAQRAMQLSPLAAIRAE